MIVDGDERSFSVFVNTINKFKALRQSEDTNFDRGQTPEVMMTDSPVLIGWPKVDDSSHINIV